MNNENENKEFEVMEETEEVMEAVEEAAEEVTEEVTEQVTEEAQEEELPELVFSDDLFLTDELPEEEPEAEEEPVQEEEPEETEIDFDEQMFLGVNAALTEQIENEFGGSEAVTNEKKENKVAAFFKMIPKWTKVLVTIILVLLLSVGFLFGTKPGRKLFSSIVVEILFGSLHVVPDETPTPILNETPGITQGGELSITPVPTEGADPWDDPTPTVDPLATPEPTPTPLPVNPNPVMDSEDVINILLLGEENIYGATYGRTDAIMVASINIKTGEISVVSFLRDTYVQIPGWPDDRLNAAYAKGGADLMMQTIETNFKIDIDSYVVIDFAGFEKMIDDLGGLEISLTARESEYLNTTRYISNADERNTVPGKQMLTGSQVLGYCRVRKVPTENGLNDDYGRTYRHRTVLKALFNKYKEKNLVELFNVMNKCMKHVTVPEGLKTLATECLAVVMEYRALDFETLQIPATGYYKETTIAGKEVISFYPANVEILQDFLYGEDAD